MEIRQGRNLFGQQFAHAKPGLMQSIARAIFGNAQQARDAGMIVAFHVVHQENHFFGVGQLDHGAFQVNP